MDCEIAREAISALLDDEPLGVQEASLEQHLSACQACRAWREAAHEVTRRARLSPARSADAARQRVVEDIRAHEASNRRRRPVTVARSALYVVGVAQIAIMVPLIVSGGSDVTRDVAAGGMALAVGFLIVAWRPARARAISPVVGTAACMLAAITVINVVQRVAVAADEVSHLVALVGWLLIHRLARLIPPTGEGPLVPISHRLRGRIGMLGSRRKTSEGGLAHGGRSPGTAASGESVADHMRAESPQSSSTQRAGRDAVA